MLFVQHLVENFMHLGLNSNCPSLDLNLEAFKTTFLFGANKV